MDRGWPWTRRFSKTQLKLSSYLPPRCISKTWDSWFSHQICRCQAIGPPTSRNHKQDTQLPHVYSMWQNYWPQRRVSPYQQFDQKSGKAVTRQIRLTDFITSPWKTGSRFVKAKHQMMVATSKLRATTIVFVPPAAKSIRSLPQGFRLKSQPEHVDPSVRNTNYKKNHLIAMVVLKKTE